MAWRFHGRATVDPSNPSAFGVCDRCGLTYNRKDLVWQYDWRGNSLQNIRLLVCTVTCLDKPFELQRPLKLPPDPETIRDARPEIYYVDEE
jgi:hypothetical protein